MIMIRVMDCRTMNIVLGSLIVLILEKVIIGS